MRNSSRFAAEQLLNASQPFKIQYGEQIHHYFFAPLRKYAFTEKGVKRWYAPLLVGRKEGGRGFSAANFGEEASVHENIYTPPNQLVLVAHAYETMAIRVHVSVPGTFFIAAIFKSVGFEGPYVVATAAAAIMAGYYHANANHGNGNANLFTLATTYSLSKSVSLYSELGVVLNSKTSNVGLNDRYTDPYGANVADDPASGSANFRTSPDYGASQIGLIAGIVKRF
ncbi:porin [Pararobbsia silviterrae]|uniref:Porin domain-containing protein n=1 Tax=Pararobbsia silviterrae TaxID=1792498 RepID=A0A494YCP4_9BURK|nr:hypothetical protein [Pararobbsia silviterrae]RKP57774.1 hypothetical protein D7S86_07530 [Pararobbsia silviterrae]